MTKYTQTRISDHFKIKVDGSKISDWGKILKLTDSTFTGNNVNGQANSFSNNTTSGISFDIGSTKSIAPTPRAVADSPGVAPPNNTNGAGNGGSKNDSNWMYWLLGGVVVIGGIYLIHRHYKKREEEIILRYKKKKEEDDMNRK